MKTTHALILSLVTGCLGGAAGYSLRPSQGDGAEAIQRAIPGVAREKHSQLNESWKDSSGQPGSVPRPRGGVKQAMHTSAEPALRTVSGQDLAKLRELVESDPAAALELAARLDDGAAKDFANAAARKLVLTDPQKAAELAAPLVDSHVGADPFEHVANDWAKTDPRAAVAWGTQYQGSSRSGFLLRALAGLLKSDAGKNAATLSSTASAMEELFAQPDTGDWGYAVHQVLDTLVARKLEQGDMPATLAMLDGLGAEGAPDGGKVFRRWLDEESLAASAWAKQQPPSNRRDQYVLSIIEKIAEEDPPAAQAWADSLFDPKLKTRFLGKFQAK